MKKNYLAVLWKRNEMTSFRGCVLWGHVSSGNIKIIKIVTRATAVSLHLTAFAWKNRSMENTQSRRYPWCTSNHSSTHSFLFNTSLIKWHHDLFYLISSSLYKKNLPIVNYNRFSSALRYQGSTIRVANPKWGISISFSWMTIQVVSQSLFIDLV